MKSFCFLIPLVWLFAVLLPAQTNSASQHGENTRPAELVEVHPDGMIELPAESVPVSRFLTPEAKAYLTQHLHDMQDPNMTYADKGVPRFMAPYLERQK